MQSEKDPISNQILRETCSEFSIFQALQVTTSENPRIIQLKYIFFALKKLFDKHQIK
jgi:hypothetical protein